MKFTASNLRPKTDTRSQLYLKQLQENPLRTKMLTSGSLAALQELLASWIAHDRSKHGNYFSSRIPKMAIYGAFISAPLGHVMITILQKMFRGTTSLKAKILQILVSNLIVRFRVPSLRLLANYSNPDLPNPEYRLSRINGYHCWRPYLPSSPSHCSSRLHACHEGQLDYVSPCACLCASFPS
jgi:hypothetical protein